MSKSQDHSSTTLAPLRVGVAGLTRAGLFHLESLALHRAFTPVAAAGSESKNVDGIGGCHQVSPEDLLEEPLDLTIIATSAEQRVALAREFLSHGKSVLIEAGMADATRDALEECLRIARERSLFCGIWQPAFGEADFLLAKSAVETGQLGAVRSARFLQHSLAPGPAAAAAGSFSDDDIPCAVDEARRRLAQLLELVPGAVSAIQKNVRMDDGPSIKTATAATLQMEFDSGASALIDIDLFGAVPLSTGWYLQTTAGGFARGNQTHVEADGEVFSIPVETMTEPGPANLYSQLAHVLRSTADEQLTFSENSVRQELAVADLLRHE